MVPEYDQSVYIVYLYTVYECLFQLCVFIRHMNVSLSMVSQYDRSMYFVYLYGMWMFISAWCLNMIRVYISCIYTAHKCLFQLRVFLRHMNVYFSMVAGYDRIGAWPNFRSLSPAMPAGKGNKVTIQIVMMMLMISMVKTYTWVNAVEIDVGMDAFL